MADIHKTALVNPKAELGEGVVVSPFSIIEKNVTIGDGTWIGPHVLVASGARIGKACKIHQGAVVCSIPQDLKFEGEETTLEIGDETVVREYCTLNRGTKDHWKTEIGKRCLLMAYAHVAHDCILGDNVIIANAVNMAGHVTIENFAGIGGMTPVHQFCRVGQHSFIGGGYRIVKDIPPYILAGAEPLKFGGVNSIGLRRRGFSDETILGIQRVYKIIYRKKLNVTQALTRIKDEFEIVDEIKTIVDFFETSERGVLR